MKYIKKSGAIAGALMTALSIGGVAMAAPTPTLNQTINTGTLTTDILDASRVSVASPSATMTAKNFSFTCQTGANASTGTLGTNSERLYVTNADAADNGFTLTLAATGGATSTWANSGANRRIDFNDPTGAPAGCTDGADTDTVAGQLTVNPSTGILTTDCQSCTATGVSLGSSASYNQGTTDSVTLINAGSTSDDVWRGYLTGVGLSQSIPAETAADAYTLNMTLTATAL